MHMYLMCVIQSHMVLSGFSFSFFLFFLNPLKSHFQPDNQSFPPQEHLMGVVFQSSCHQDLINKRQGRCYMSNNMQKNPPNKDAQIPNDHDFEVEGACSEDVKQNLNSRV